MPIFPHRDYGSEGGFKPRFLLQVGLCQISLSRRCVVRAAIEFIPPKQTRTIPESNGDAATTVLSQTKNLRFRVLLDLPGGIHTIAFWFDESKIRKFQTEVVFWSFRDRRVAIRDKELNIVVE